MEIAQVARQYEERPEHAVQHWRYRGIDFDHGWQLRFRLSHESGVTGKLDELVTASGQRI
jgi:hypothetical protein